MAKLLLPFVLLLTGLTLWAGPAQAAPGDTTRVTVWRQRKLTRYGNYDTTAVMPAAGKRYRKVLMHYILGRYACAPGSQYCGSWDYTTRVTLRPPAHDTVEMARIITPYATDWLTRNKTHDYVVDVTEYAPLLVGNRSLQFEYQGYSWGFNVTVRFDFIEGTPPQDPLDVTNVYRGTFQYGNAANPIENYLPARTYTAPATGSVMLKNIISGHGSDGTGCAEFCRKYYQLVLDGQARSTTYLWRSDCGLNQVYPQTGTWVYNRGNWCPGNIVVPLWHSLPALPGQSFSLDIDMQSYTSANPQGNTGYIWSSQLVKRGPINFATDASVDAIIAPNNNENYFRDNPSCGSPRLRLRNLGSNRLTTALIQYRVQGRGAVRSYNWTGNLSFNRDTLVVLPPMAELLDNAGGNFQAWVTAPNGATDLNHYNDSLRTRFDATITLPATSVVSMTTNGATVSSASTNNQTTWRLTDAAGNVVKQRVGTVTQTTYNDTLKLQPGCYVLRVADTGCNGFAWWAAASEGNGTMRILDPRRGSVLQTISGDFGCEYVMNFRVAGTVSGTASPALQAALDLYPNPSHDGRFTLDLNLPTRQNLQLRLLDGLGRVAHSQQLAQVKALVQPLDLHHLAPGVYVLEATAADGARLHRRVVID